MAEHWTQIPLLKYSPGRVLYYKKKNLIEIGDSQLAYSPCKRDFLVLVLMIKITNNLNKNKNGKNTF